MNTNSKFLPLLIVSLGVLLSACNKVEPTSLILTSPSIVFDSGGGTQELSFMTNTNWSVRSSEGWITLNPSSGSATSKSSQYVTLTVSENPSASERTAVLTVTAGDLSKQVSVTQAGAPATSLVLKTSAVTMESKAGTEQVSFQTNKHWTASSSAAWLEVSPASGEGAALYQSLTLSVQQNTGDSERNATVRIQAGEMSAEIAVTQLSGAQITISAFRAKSVDKTTWYKLTGEIASIENEEYGNFFIFDDTGFVYVYGLCETQVSTNDQSFSKLGLKVGDTVTLMTLRSEHNGTIEAGGTTPSYFVSKTAGEYKLGRKVSSTKAGWLELPATSGSDGQDLLIHSFPDGSRNYAAYWDYDNLVSSWVAYPLCAGNIGTGERTEKFTLNPLLSRDKQPYLPKAYQAGNTTQQYDRGHQIASADRWSFRVNLETFFGTNMTPQDNGLNGKAWGVLEGKVRDWAKKSDTLYVVTGCVTKGSDKYVLDADGKHVTVPKGYYKALLRLSGGAYSAAGFWFDNVPNSAGSIQKSMAMSIDQLEEKVGVDFFVNLPADTQATVEAQDPAAVAWWWNN